MLRADIRYRIGLWWTRVRRRLIQILTPGRPRAVLAPMFSGTPSMKSDAMLLFVPRGRRNDGRPGSINVISRRGQMEMGKIEWSNQWGRPRFKSHPEAIFDIQCIAEIYAAMKDLK